MAYLNDQTGDIISATEKLNGLVGQFAASDPIVERTLKTLPDALSVLKDNRTKLADALARLGKFSALTADTVNGIKDNLVTELNQLGPVVESLANAGPNLTRSLSMLATYPWPNETLDKWCRGDYCNLTAIFDLNPQSSGCRTVHRHPMGRQPDRTGDAVGPHHRADAEPVHGWQSADRAVPLRSGAVT